MQNKMKEMKPFLLSLFIIVGLFLGIVAFAAPTQRFDVSIWPIFDSAYELGTSTKAWSGGTFDKLCLTADICRTTWPVGGAGGGIEWPFTKQADGVQATSTTLGFFNGFLSIASSSVSSTFRLPLLSNGGLGVFGGHVISGATTTAGTGLTYSGNAFNVNTSQNIDTLSNLTTNGFVKTGCGVGTLSVDTTTYLSSMTFSFPWLKLSTNELATSTTLAFLNGFLSTASSNLTNFLATNSTTTSATTTNFASTNICLTGDTCRTTWPSAAAGLPWPFTKLSSNEQATSTTLALLNGFLSTSSSTLSSFTYTTATGTSATTTGLAISGLSSELLKVNSNGSVIEAIAGTDYQAAGSYALQATTLTIAGTAGQIASSAGAQDLSTNRTWTLSIPNSFNFGVGSTTVLDIGNAYFGTTATSSFNGAGNLFVVGSTTLQNFTAQNSTTTQATTTSFFSTVASSTNLFSSVFNFGSSLFTLISNTFTGLGIWDLGGATSLEIPNGTGPTLNAIGQLAWDTTSGNLAVSTSTTGHVVIGSATTTLYAFAVSSTSPDFLSGGIIELPSHFLPQVVTGVICDSDAGTSVVVNLSDGTNDTNTATCTTTSTQFPITTNNTFTAYEGIRLEVGTITGTVDRLSLRFIGYRTSD